MKLEPPPQLSSDIAIKGTAPASKFDVPWKKWFSDVHGNIDAVAADVNTMALLLTSPTTAGTIYVRGFHSAGDGGSTPFYWDASANKNTHNGGTIIDPENTADLATWDATAKTTWFTAGTGSGCWKRLYDDEISVAWFGAKGDGSEEDDKSIQACIDAVELLGGGVVYFPVGIYQTDTTLVIDSDDVVLKGEGSSHDVTGSPNMDELAATAIRWSGTAGSTVVKYTAISGASNRSIRRGGMIDIHIEGLNTVAKGLEVYSVKFAIFQRISIRDCTSVGLDMGVVATLNEARDTQHCVFSDISIRQVKSTSGIGINQSGDTVANISVNHFKNIVINHDDGIALDINGSDSNLFELIRIFRQPGGTGVGVDLSSGASAPLAARGNIFSFLNPGSGGVQARGGTANSNNNLILGLSQENGAPDPGIADGANLSLISDLGLFELQTENALIPTHRFQRASATPAQIIGQTFYRVMNDASALKSVATVDVVLGDDTAGSEDGELRLSTMVAGTNGVRVSVKGGVEIGSPTGGNFGADTLNASVLYADGIPWQSGSGTPESVVTAPIGSLFSRTDGGSGTTLYVKESGTGNTGWVAK